MAKDKQVVKRPGVLGWFVVFCVFVVPIGLIGPGVWLLAQRAWGTKVEAQVLGCVTHVSGRSSSEDCTAVWTIDGRRVEGPIEGSGDFEVGKHVTATVRGDTAYSRSLSLPLILIALGIPFAIVPVRWTAWLVRGLVRKRRHALLPGQESNLRR